MLRRFAGRRRERGADRFQLVTSADLFAAFVGAIVLTIEGVTRKMFGLEAQKLLAALFEVPELSGTCANRPPSDSHRCRIA